MTTPGSAPGSSEDVKTKRLLPSKRGGSVNFKLLVLPDHPKKEHLKKEVNILNEDRVNRSNTSLPISSTAVKDKLPSKIKDNKKPLTAPTVGQPVNKTRVVVTTSQTVTDIANVFPVKSPTHTTSASGNSRNKIRNTESKNNRSSLKGYHHNEDVFSRSNEGIVLHYDKMDSVVNNTKSNLNASSKDNFQSSKVRSETDTEGDSLSKVTNVLKASQTNIQKGSNKTKDDDVISAGDAADQEEMSRQQELLKFLKEYQADHEDYEIPKENLKGFPRGDDDNGRKKEEMTKDNTAASLKLAKENKLRAKRILEFSKNVSEINKERN